jgi:hypothetical protein
MDDLSIPDFLRRPAIDIKPQPIRRGRQPKIDYPKNGYKMFGKRKAAREKHRAQLRRRAERMRQR